jgi:branched-chain amino acid transport system permease protein
MMRAKSARGKAAVWVFGAIGVFVAALPLWSGPYVQSIGRSVLTYLVLAISWDMLIRSGQLSFGIAGFFGLGSYAAVMAAKFLNMPGVLTLVFAGVVVAIVAAGLGAVVLRLRGMYFAITTLALAEIFRVIIRNWDNFTGGPAGALTPSVIFGGNSVAGYLLMLVLAVLAIAASEWFQRGKLHFALTAIRNNEIVAKSSGISIYRYLLIAFVITSAIQGVVGASYAQLFGFVTPESSFNVNYTLIPLAIALFGGMYTTWGPVVGAIVLGVVGEYLKLYIPYGHLIVYGIIIVLVLLFMPKGIVGLIRARLHAGGEK